ncbi:MAG: trigger factor [Oscillospiraceae bacterium]|jgi:trigger factor|nr:trigger factor [Oscillospiraceae bacterium]
MKLIGQENKGNHIVCLTVEVSAEEFAPALERSFRKNSPGLTVHGFRKGKAPRKMIEKIYGEGVFYEDAVAYAYPEAYAAAVAEAGIKPVVNPDVNVESISEAEGFVFTASVTVRPPVELGAYKGLSAEYAPRPVTEADIDAHIARLRERNAAMQAVERPAAEGDTVLLDYEGSIDGVPFDGGKAVNAQLDIGARRFITGFEEQIPGHSAGEEFEITVTFPEGYPSAALAGKTAVFAVKLHEVREKLLPRLDDEFAKDVSEYDTMEQLRQSVAEQTEEANRLRADAEFEDRLIRQMIDNAKVDIPDVMVEQETDGIMRELAYRMYGSGIDLQAYLSSTGQTAKSLRDSHKAEAAAKAKAELVFDAVAEAENLTVTDEETDAEYARLSREHSAPREAVEKSLSAEALRSELLMKKVVKTLVDSAVKTAPAPGGTNTKEDKAP